LKNKKSKILILGLDNCGKSTILLSLKDKLDALIESGNELSKNLSVDEQYRIMKKVIADGTDKAIQNLSEDLNTKFTENELNEFSDETRSIINALCK